MKKTDLETHLEEQVTLRGTAKNAKGYAVLITKDNIVVYIKELPEWAETILNSPVKVKGLLKQINLIPDPYIDENGAISQGAEGKQYVLVNYELMES